MKIASIAIFGVLGVLTRYSVNSFVEKFFNYTLPMSTFAINILGSFLIGIVYAFGVEKSVISPELRLGLAVGFLGGFTTFSSYSLETAVLFEKGQIWSAALYFLSSPILGLVGTFLGLASGRALLSQ